MPGPRKELREERFAYTPPPPSFSRTLARAYVTRGRWGRPVGFAVVALAVAAVAFQVFVRGPELRQATEVPAELTAAFEMLDANTDDPAALVDVAESLLSDADARARLGATARAVYDRRFSLERTVEALLSR